MPIYTRTGDRGMTSLFSGKRISKSHPRVEAYGTLDELTSFTGLVAAKLERGKDTEFLTAVQKDLYTIMANLSGSSEETGFLRKKALDFEKRIDELGKKLPELKNFIIPGGTELSAWFHILRVVCRKAERRIANLSERGELKNHEDILIYVNRLSDLFFMMARKYGQKNEVTL